MTHSRIRVGITGVALALAGLHLAFPALRIDAATALLVVVALLPWLAPIVKSFKLPGGFEVELQELKQKALDAHGAAESAARRADLALATAGAGSTAAATAAPADDDLAALAREYVAIRAQQGGPHRASAMTAVIGRMMAAAPQVQVFDVAAALRDEDPGARLAAYAYLYARPEPAMLEPLVRSVTVVEDRPFGQYWGLRAVGAVAAAAGGIPERARDQLARFGATLDPGSDRAYEVRKLLATPWPGRRG
jgi:hypothetical protein